MKKNLILCFSLLFILSGVYYLISEFVAIYYCSDSYSAYYAHTISELGVPIGSLWYGSKSTFSSMARVMNLALIINGIIFLFCYSILFVHYFRKPFYFLCLALALVVSVGSIFVGLFHGGNAIKGMHDIGTVMVFAGGNILLILTGIFSNLKHRLYRILIIIFGLIGFLCGAYILVLTNQQFLPMLERLTVYPIVFFEIYTGIIMIRARKHLN